MATEESFAALGLPDPLVDALARRRLTSPFEIQRLAIPDAMAGRDLLGRAPTGSGKTLAFGLPMLARVEAGGRRRPRGLILSPTRELAEQITRELEPLAAAVDRSVLAVYGGTGLTPQIKRLRAGVDVLVACPGRLLDLIDQGAVSLDAVEIAVVDEADRMADMGFLPDVRKLLDQTAADRQTVLFSATLDDDVQVLIDTYQQDPVVHQVGEVEPDLSLVDHRFIKIKKADRIWLAADLIADAGPTVVFVRTRHGVDRVARQLKAEGVSAGNIHGGRTQAQRDRALQVFTDGKVQALVATDVAARGIHVDGVACVIHYDPPAELKDYVHRSGRTARAGAGGTVVSFLDGGQVGESAKMRKKLGIEAEVESPPARKPRSSRPDPIEDRRSGPKRGAKIGSKHGQKNGQKDGQKPTARSKNGTTPTDERKQRPKRAAGAKTGAKRDVGARNGAGGARTATTDRRATGERGATGDRKATGERKASRDRRATGERGATGDRKATGAGRAAAEHKAGGSSRAASTGTRTSPKRGGRSGSTRRTSGATNDGNARATGPRPDGGRGPGKARAKSKPKSKGGPKSKPMPKSKSGPTSTPKSKGGPKPKSKRSGRPRPPNRKGGAKASRSR
ncbi:MAG: DEAD/DEAH box helicase [Actinomycetota bacterium]